ncbi:hypothetical protein PVAP13_5NG583150 [Panicum virgatum]|uniref:Uncharacterized protein n=1 Tax=Panicum virgatum TaxID=38727 RepID=A0A8T0S5B0_PANVG|nr:hypothetical protein PVAP13_5NG583150 [Panicum virgatum]
MQRSGRHTCKYVEHTIGPEPIGREGSVLGLCSLRPRTVIWMGRRALRFQNHLNPVRPHRLVRDHRKLRRRRPHATGRPSARPLHWCPRGAPLLTPLAAALGALQTHRGPRLVQLHTTLLSSSAASLSQLAADARLLATSAPAGAWAPRSGAGGAGGHCGDALGGRTSVAEIQGRRGRIWRRRAEIRRLLWRIRRRRGWIRWRRDWIRWLPWPAEQGRGEIRTQAVAARVARLPGAAVGVRRGCPGITESCALLPSSHDACRGARTRLARRPSSRTSSTRRPTARTRTGTLRFARGTRKQRSAPRRSSATRRGTSFSSRTMSTTGRARTRAEVAEVLSVPPGFTAALLRHFRWGEDAAQRRSRGPGAAFEVLRRLRRVRAAAPCRHLCLCCACAPCTCCLCCLCCSLVKNRDPQKGHTL